MISLANSSYLGQLSDLQQSALCDRLESLQLENQHQECWNLRIGWQPSFRSAEKLVLSNHFIELEGVLAIIESEYYNEQLTLSLRIELAFKRRSE